MSINLNGLQETIGIQFNNDTLLRQALVHDSFLHENPDFELPSNERLEFLGDALLDFIVGEYLYEQHPEMNEGKLTRLRAALINASTLARFARSIDLGQHIYLSHGEDDPGGRGRVGLLSDAFEALVAAIYLDAGLEATRDFLIALVEPEAGRIVESGLEGDPKGRLQEWTQREQGAMPEYRAVKEQGPVHAKEFTVEVLVSGEVYGRGQGRSKQVAEEEAAKEALEEIERRQA